MEENNKEFQEKKDEEKITDFYDVNYDLFQRDYDPFFSKENNFDSENQNEKKNNLKIQQNNMNNEMFNNFYGYEMGPFYNNDHSMVQNSNVNNNINNNNVNNTVNNEIFFREPHSDTQPQLNNELFTARPFHDLEQPLYVNAHQFNCIRKRKMRRDYLDTITMNKSSSSYLHESRHRHAMNRLRAPSGRFLTKEEAEEMRARENQEENQEEN